MCEDVALVEARGIKFLPGDLPACDRCGQRPDSITFDMIDCRPGCPLASDGLRNREADTICA